MYVCMCVCMCVCRLCASVCGSAHAQTDKLILIQFCKNDLTNICEVCFSQILKLRNRWRHGGHFSHGRNLCPIYFKIGHDVELLHPLFAIWNQQNQSVTFGFIQHHVSEIKRQRHNSQNSVNWHIMKLSFFQISEVPVTQSVSASLWQAESPGFDPRL